MPPKPWLGDVVSDADHEKNEVTISCPSFICDYCGCGPQAGSYRKGSGTFEYLRCGVCKTVVAERQPIEAAPPEGQELAQVE